MDMLLGSKGGGEVADSGGKREKAKVERKKADGKPESGNTECRHHDWQRERDCRSYGTERCESALRARNTVEGRKG